MDTSCEDDWTPRALCLGKSDLFELSEWPDDQSHPHYQSQIEDWVNVESRKFRKAEEICLECPVFMACHNSADRNDKDYSMRAGEWPAILSKTVQAPGYKCDLPSHGREGKLMPYCQKCVRDTNRRRLSAKETARRKALKAARKAAADPRFV